MRSSTTGRRGRRLPTAHGGSPAWGEIASAVAPGSWSVAVAQCVSSVGSVRCDECDGWEVVAEAVWWLPRLGSGGDRGEGVER